MRRHKSLLLTLLMITSTLVGFAAVPASADEITNGVDVSDDSATPEQIPLSNTWYEGNLSGTDDQYDYYKYVVNAADTLVITVVAGDEAVEFGYQLYSDAQQSYLPEVKGVVNAFGYAVWDVYNSETTTSSNPIKMYFNDTVSVDTNAVNDYCFRVIHLSNNAWQNNADCSFNTAPSIPTVTTTGDPSGGGTIDIGWTTTGYVTGIKVDISVDGGDVWHPWAGGVTYTNNESSLTIPVPRFSTENAVVRISDSTYSTSSANGKSDYFSIAWSGAGSDCGDFGGKVGPAYDSTTSYMALDVVEYPAGGGMYWMAMSDFLSTVPSSTDVNWSGPCNCTEISFVTGNQVSWDSNDPYHPWDVVVHDGQIWISNMNENTYEPVVGDPYGLGIDPWILCDNTSSSGGGGTDGGCTYEDAAQYNGYGGPVWNNGDSTTTGSIYEYPANSGEFWIATVDLSSAPAPDSAGGPEAWEGSCNCSEIWNAAGTPTYDATQNYNQWFILEHPSGSGNLWITPTSSIAGEEPGMSNDVWRLCGNHTTTGGGDVPGDGGCPGETAASFNGYGGPLWVANQAYAASSIVEWPAASGEFWKAKVGVSAGSSQPDNNADWLGACNCSEIWTYSSDVWSASGQYDWSQIVEHNGDLYISLVYQNQNSEPGKSDKTWRICGGAEPSPCDRANGFAGPWYDQSQHSYQENDVVEYPAGTGIYYVSTFDGNTAHPNDGELRGWVRCNCSELWDGTQYTAGTIYSEYKIVENGGTLYIRTAAGHLMSSDPAPPHRWYWRTCEPGYCQPLIFPWSQSWANSGLYDEGVVVRESWFSNVKWRSLVDDNTNPLPSGAFTPLGNSNGWERCKVRIEWDIYDPADVRPPEGGVSDVYNSSIHSKIRSGSTIYIYQDDSSLARYYLLVKNGFNDYDCVGPCVDPNTGSPHSCAWGSAPMSKCGVGSALSDTAELLDVQSYPGMNCDEFDTTMFEEGNIAVCVGGTVVTGGESGSGGCWTENGGLMWMDNCTATDYGNTLSITHPLPVVTGTCDYASLEMADIMIEGSTSSTECGAMIIIPADDNATEGMVTDVGGHLLVQNSGMVTDGEDEYGMAYKFTFENQSYYAFNFVGLTCGALEFPVTEWRCTDSVVERMADSSTTAAGVDTTPRISLWPGKVNQHNLNGIWMTDPDGKSGGHPNSNYPNDYGGMELEYCQKFWPETTSVFKRAEKETITFYTAGNTHAYESTKDVWECVQPEENETVGNWQDADGDGVPDEWDDCPDSGSDTMTDNKGCTPEDIKDAASDEGGYVPAVGIAGVMASMFAALFITRRRLNGA